MLSGFHTLLFNQLFQQLSWQFAAKLSAVRLYLTLNGSRWAGKMKYKVFEFGIVNSWDHINFAKGSLPARGLEVERRGLFMTCDLN